MQVGASPSPRHGALMKPTAKSPLRKVCAAAAVALALTFWMPCAARAQRQVENARHGFHDVAHWAKLFESPARAKWQKPGEVVRALGLKSGETVIDIGAGTGYFTRRFARAVAPSGQALGLDIEPAMVDYMKAGAKKLGLANYGARLVKPDDPGLAPRSADVVFFCDVLHHMEDRTAYLSRLSPALKPGARVVVIDFTKASPIGPPLKRRIAPAQVIGEFSKAGYRLVRERHFLPYQYFLEFKPGARG